MNTTLLDQDVKRYVDAVAAALIDLPDATRGEILEDLAAHLTEFDLADGPLDVQLGDPGAYAEELRTAAGFAPPPPPHTAGATRIGAQVRRVVETIRMHRWWRSTLAFLPSLEPAWWVARAWLLVVVMAGANPTDIPIPAPNDNWFVGLLLLAVLIPFSVRLGQGAKRSHGRHLNRAASALGIVLLFVLFGGVREQPYIYASSYDELPEQYLAEATIPLFDRAGDVALDTRALVIIDERGYMAEPEQTVILDGLATRVGPCPNGRPYAACLVEAPTTAAPPTTITTAPPTTVEPALPTTAAVPAAPTTSGG